MKPAVIHLVWLSGRFGGRLDDIKPDTSHPGYGNVIAHLNDPDNIALKDDGIDFIYSLNQYSSDIRAGLSVYDL